MTGNYLQLPWLQNESVEMSFNGGRMKHEAFNTSYSRRLVKCDR